MDFWNQFAEELKKEGEKRPTGKGWKTVEELSKIIKLHRSRVPGVMKKGIDRGKIEAFHGQIYRDKFLRKATWYRPK